MKYSLCLLLVALSFNAHGQELESVIERSVEGVDSAEHINFLHQREWVRLGANGIVDGKLLVLSSEGSTDTRIGAKVIVSRDGKAILETTTDGSGAFQLGGLEPGTYAIQCRGDYTFAAYALHVLPANAKHLSSDLEIYASVIPAARANELLAGDLVPVELSTGRDEYYRTHDQDPIAEDRKFNNSPKVVLRKNALVGRVSRPGWAFAEQDLRGTVAQIVQDGVVVGKTSVGKDGYYEIADVKPGVYDLFVTGDDGFAVLAFEAIAAGDEPVATKAGGVRMVSMQVGMVSDCLCCELVQQPEITACSTCGPPVPVIEEVVSIVEPCGCGQDPCGCGGAPVCGGGYAGGFSGGGGYGGGGGGGGFGGIGGLLGVAGLAIGVAALADDDNGNGFNVNLATPFN